MKKIIFAFAATLSILALAGCHKNDDKVTIQGKWYAQTLRFQEYENGTPTYDSTTTFTGGSYFEFLSDNTFNVKDEDGSTYSYTYSYNEDTKKLSTMEDGDAYEYDVTKLTSTELTLHEEETETSDNITYHDIYDVNFKK